MRFNTSHVTLYLPSTESVMNYNMFQYISCYSLSENYGKMFRKNICFNTSHVTLYRPEGITFWIMKTGFNTSHITLYRNVITGEPLPEPGFNTSHVTLYRTRSRGMLRVQEFQYISCYSLSCRF